MKTVTKVVVGLVAGFASLIVLIIVVAFAIFLGSKSAPATSTVTDRHITTTTTESPAPPEEALKAFRKKSARREDCSVNIHVACGEPAKEAIEAQKAENAAYFEKVQSSRSKADTQTLRDRIAELRKRIQKTESSLAIEKINYEKDSDPRRRIIRRERVESIQKTLASLDKSLKKKLDELGEEE